jgi:hypothetical protein
MAAEPGIRRVGVLLPGWVLLVHARVACLMNESLGSSKVKEVKTRKNKGRLFSMSMTMETGVSPAVFQQPVSFFVGGGVGL